MRLTSRQSAIIKSIASASIKSVRAIAEGLVEIRDLFKEEEQWVEFARSNALGYGERTIYDYCSAHTWLSTTEVDDEVLGKLSVRSMAWLAQLQASEDNSFADLEQRLLEGEVLTQADIRPPSEKKDERLSRTELVEMVRQFKNDGDKLKRELNFWKDALHLVEKNNGVELTVYSGNVDEITETDPLWQRITVSNKKKTVNKRQLAPV